MKTSSLLATMLPARRLALGALFLGAHAWAVTLLPARAELVSTIFMVTASLLAGVACLRAARAADFAARPGWIFAAVAMLVWSSGSILATWVDLSRGAPCVVVGAPDFLNFFYGVAILLAATWSEDDALGGLAFWFDGFQAVLAGWLAYVAIFHVFPFSPDKIQPISASLLVRTYDVENGILTCLVVLRLFGRDASPSRWVFDRSMLVFTLTYGVIASLYNHLFADTPGWHDAILDLPFLALAAIATARGEDRRPASPRRRFIAFLVDSAGPIVFTATILSFGAMVVDRHPAFGVCSILSALLIYGLRAALLQSRYLQVQQALGQARDHLERLSLEDSLTGVANRRHFDRFLEHAWNDAQRSDPVSLLLLDVDHFKNLNDRQGHQAGDECLTRIAAVLRAASRRTDLVARYGGEEFAVVLPHTDLAAASLLGDAIRSSVHELRIANQTGDGMYLTVSIGAASTEDDPGRHSDFLVQAADLALYAAKQCGRNRVVAAPRSGEIAAGALAMA